VVVIEVEASVLASLETELHRYCNRARKSGAVVCSVRSSEFRSSSMAWFAVQLDRRQDCELRRIGGRGVRPISVSSGLRATTKSYNLRGIL